MYKNHEYFLSLYYRITDLLVLNLAFLLGIYFRFNKVEHFSFIDSNYASLLLFTNITWLFISSFHNLYNPQYFISKNRYYIALITAISLQLLISIGFNGLIKTFYSRLFLISTYVSFSILLAAGRGITFWLYNLYLNKNQRKSIVILFGLEENLKELTDFFNQNLTTKKQGLKVLDEKKHLVYQLKELKKEYFISEVYLPISRFSEDEVEEISNFCDNYFIRMRLIFDWKKIGVRKITASKISQTTIFKIALSPLDDSYNSLLKRGFDLIVTLIACLVLFSWLFPIIAVMIKLTSKGPVFFKQQRSGINNKGFYCYKFRSMKPNDEADTKQATQKDDRITKVGAFLRRTSLDELPQFINVLKGEMSIVGPRPHMLKHTEEYSLAVGNYMNRQAIKPGITGLAQIKGYRGEIDDIILLQNRIKLDRFYVNNWTLFFDMKIVAATFLEVFKDHK